MIIYHHDPKGLLGKNEYKLDFSKTIFENLQLNFPDGLSYDIHDIYFNDEKINPFNFDLCFLPKKTDTITIVRRQGATALIGIGIAIIFAVGTILLTPKPKIPNSSGEVKNSSNNQLTGQKNVARLYQAKPDIYGSIRCYPDLVKPSGSEYINNIKYVDHLLCVGVGEYELDNFKYSESLLDTITGTTYHHYRIGDVIPSVTFQYASDEVNGQELTPPNLIDPESTALTDFFPLPEKGTEIWVDLIFPRGFKGDVNLQFIFWAIDDEGDEIPNSRQIEYWNRSDDTYEQKRYTVKFIPRFGFSRYTIQCGRINNGKSDLSDQVQVENIYIVTYEHDFKVTDTLVYVRTKATPQATSLKELKFNVEATRKTISYNVEDDFIDYTLKPSRSFADAVLHEFTIVAGRDPNELDLTSLYTIANNLKDERLGYFDFSFDDSDISLGQRIQTICNAARVFTYRDGQKWRFVRDEEKLRPSALFNSLNLVNNDDGGTIQFKSSLPTSYDGIELEYIESTKDNIKTGTDKKAYINLKINKRTGAIVNELAKRPSKIQLAGCRNKYQAMNRAQMEARKLLYQRVTVEDEAMRDANFVNKGDLVNWVDTWDEALVSGEITEIKDGKLYVNQSLELDNNKNYRVRITNINGYPSEWMSVKTHSENYFTADFNDAYVANNSEIQMGSLFLIVETVSSEPLDFILTEKQYNNGNYKINLVNYDKRIYEYDTR